MAGARIGRLVLVSFVVLAACEPGQEFNLFYSGESPTNSDDATVVVSGGAVEQDVESPEIFQVTDSGLWDGRPSLGGVWIAHPDVTDPERVLIRNQDNGNSIVGALFRRERENPGPRFQVSSDAATELGMLAGSPNTLAVVALRRVEVPVIAEPIDTLESTAIDTTIVAPVADEQMTVSEAVVPMQSAPAEPLASIASIAASAIEAATESNPVASLPEPATAAETALQATANVAPVARPAVAPLSALNRPFIQLGIFSVQSNAEDTSDLLRSAGIIPTIETYTQNDKPYWRVLVGPIGNTSERRQIIGQIKSLGFPDAYAVTN